jgi:hypothetical protein
MKTKIRSFIVICTLGFVGALNVNATSICQSSCNLVALEEEKNVKSEDLNSAEFIFDESSSVVADYQKEAEAMTRWIADREEAKVFQMVMNKLNIVSDEDIASFAGEVSREYLPNQEFDYQKEAGLVTKQISDQKEATVIQKLIDEGKLAENR